MTINNTIHAIDTTSFRFMKDQSLVQTFKTGLELKIAGDFQKKFSALLETVIADSESVQAKLAHAEDLGLSKKAVEQKQKALETLQKKEKVLNAELQECNAFLDSFTKAESKKALEQYNKINKVDSLLVDYLVKWFTGGCFVAERHEQIGDLCRNVAVLRRTTKYAVDPLALRQHEDYQKARDLIKRDFTRLDNDDVKGVSFFRRYRADLKAHEIDYITDLLAGVEPSKDSKTGIMLLKPYSNKKIARILFGLQMMKLQGIKISADTADDLRKVDY